MRTAAMGCLAILLVAPAAAADAPAPSSRPVLEQYQGRYFRWATPRGWSMNETTNGVDLNAPDGKTFVSSALLVGGFGRMTPRGFLGATLRQVNPSAQIVEAQRLPSQPGILAPWIVEDFAITATVQGVPVRAQATVGVSEAYGRYSAVVMMYQAPVASWPQARLWLPAVAQSITVTNPRQVARQDQVMLPRNNPLDNSGLIESWRQKGLSEDRISEGRREGTMGYTRMQDPQNELLRKLPPGE